MQHQQGGTLLRSLLNSALCLLVSQGQQPLAFFLLPSLLMPKETAILTIKDVFNRYEEQIQELEAQVVTARSTLSQLRLMLEQDHIIAKHVEAYPAFPVEGTMIEMIEYVLLYCYKYDTRPLNQTLVARYINKELPKAGKLSEDAQKIRIPSLLAKMTRQKVVVKVEPKRGRKTGFIHGTWLDENRVKEEFKPYLEGWLVN